MSTRLTHIFIEPIRHRVCCNLDCPYCFFKEDVERYICELNGEDLELQSMDTTGYPTYYRTTFCIEKYPYKSLIQSLIHD